MPQNGNVKLKLLYLIEILREQTDEEHALSAEELCEQIYRLGGFEVERRTIYKDISILQEYGYNIVKTMSTKRGFFLASREFELPEVRLISDAIQAASFITSKKTNTLISKLKGMVSKYQAGFIFSQVYVDKRVKNNNEEIFYNIELTNTAINQGKKISFLYSHRIIDEHENIISNTREFLISPYALIWNNDHYYLVGNYDKYDNLMHLRVDRMKHVEIKKDPIRPFVDVCDYNDYFDTADYAKTVFNMFGGEMQSVEIRCADKLLEQVLDRFGDDVKLRSSGDEHFVINVRSNISEGFIGWILQFNVDIEVLSPKEVRENIAKRITEMNKIYF